MERRVLRLERLAWLVASALCAAALYPTLTRQLEKRRVAQRLERIETVLAMERCARTPLDPAVSLRVQRLSPWLASWETVGGCGAGTSAGAGTVKWIGRNTTGGLFQNITQLNYTHLHSAYNLTLTDQITRDLSDQWSVGVLVPFVYKRYNDFMMLNPAVDISNGGIGDVNLLGTFKFGESNENALTLSVGIPTATWHAKYKMSYLTQDKQLGAGAFSGALTFDHTMDQTWGVIVLGGVAGWRGGRNALANYRAPFASAYGYAGYFLGPFVPALGLSFTGFPKPDRDRTLEQDVPLLLLAPNASIEWSTDWIAVLVGVSLPIGLYAKKSAMVEGLMSNPSSTGLQPWTAAVGVSVSPF